MAIVIPDSILSNKNTEYVRDWLIEKSVIRGIISLPSETFSPFGANIKTSILVLRKLRANENSSNDSKVFMSEISNVGYDASGREKSGSDLEELLNNFEEFILKEGW